MQSIPVSLEVLAGVLGTPAGSVSDALKADDSDEWKPQSDIDAYFKSTFNSKLKSIRKEGHDEGHGRGKRESLSDKEKELREKHGLKGQTLEEMFEEIQAQKESAKSGLDEDSIKASPVFQEAVRKLQEKVQEKDKEIKTIQESVRTKELHGELRKLATAIVDNKENKFIIPEDPSNPTIRQTQIDLYFEQLKKQPWKVEDGKGLVPLNEKGDDQLKDDSFNPITGTDYAKQVAQRMFPQAKGEQRETPGVGTKPPGSANGSNGAGTMSFPAFKTQQEALEYIRTVKDPKQLEQLSKHVETLVAEGSLN